MKTYYNRSTKTFLGLVALALTAPLASAGDMSKEKRDGKESTAIRATAVEGMDVISKGGNELGAVSDVVFSPESGQIDSLIVSTGFLGIGGPDKRIPIDKLDNPNLEPWDIRTNLDGAMLDSAQSFEDSKVESGQMLVMDLINRDAESESGGDVGEVHDWLVDVQNGNVPFVIIRQIDPIINANFQYFAVSTERIVGSNEAGNLVVQVDDEELTEAKNIGENTLLSGGDEDAEIYRFRYNASELYGRN